jgi:hypothetical protein
VIQLASSCTVDLTTNGLNGLDTGSLGSNKTYFFYAVADQTQQTSGTGAVSSCIASAGTAPAFGTIYGHGIYRLVGALYTDGSSNLIQFHQDGDTFYLASSVPDIQTGTVSVCAGTIGTTATLCPLSVPCGRMSPTCGPLPAPFTVEAFGRVVGGTQSGLLYLSSPSQLDSAPVNFPSAPGFSTANTGGVGSPTFASAFPFHLQTDASGELRVRGSGTVATAYEITDGWIWHRQQ